MDQPAGPSGRRRTVRTWPLLSLAAPVAVAVWSGWVGIGQMTGFGEIRPLPGIWNSLHIDTAVTLPVGVEAYAAFALHAWLTGSPSVSPRTRRFAGWSAIASLVLGIMGQVAYHLLAQAGEARAPWEVATLVSCLPVLVLGAGTALAQMLRADSCASGPADGVQDRRAGPGPARPRSRALHYHAGLFLGHPRTAPGGPLPRPARCRASVLAGDGEQGDGSGMRACPDRVARPSARLRMAEAQAVASQLIASGQRVSRRSLRAAGLQGSNADLGRLAHILRSRSRPERTTRDTATGSA
jgi:hypothetical protein